MATLEWLDDESLAQHMLLEEMQRNVKALFAQVCALDCGCALLRFLDANPRTLLALDDIAYHVHASPALVESGLQGMVDLSLARRVDILGVAFFGATTDPGRQALVRELCLWQDRWHSRLERLERLVDGKIAPHLAA
jgi:hypothetical protein